MECSGKRCVQSPIKRDMKMFNKAGHAVSDKAGCEMPGRAGCAAEYAWNGGNHDSSSLSGKL